MKIKIYSNQVLGGWNPNDIDRFLGGSESSVVLLSESFVRSGFDVTVYHSKKSDDQSNVIFRNGVEYLPRESATFSDSDILITFKDLSPFKVGVRCKKNFHVSCDIEYPFNTSVLDKVIFISEYQRKRHAWISVSRSEVIPLGVDFDLLNSQITHKNQGQILYSSSPDRGLLTLLNDWQTIREKHPNVTLKISYGFGFFEKSSNPAAKIFIDDIKTLMDQDGIEYVGSVSRKEMAKLYWESEYWCLPLNRADSELFCINAINARYCRTIPIINRIGALQNTAGDYIDYKRFVGGSTEIISEFASVQIMDFDQIVAKFWKPLIAGER